MAPIRAMQILRLATFGTKPTNWFTLRSIPAFSFFLFLFRSFFVDVVSFLIAEVCSMRGVSYCMRPTPEVRLSLIAWLWDLCLKLDSVSWCFVCISQTGRRDERLREGGDGGGGGDWSEKILFCSLSARGTRFAAACVATQYI